MNSRESLRMIGQVKVDSFKVSNLKTGFEIIYIGPKTRGLVLESSKMNKSLISKNAICRFRGTVGAHLSITLAPRAFEHLDRHLSGESTLEFSKNKIKSNLTRIKFIDQIQPFIHLTCH